MSKNSVNIDKIKNELKFNSLFLSNYYLWVFPICLAPLYFLAPFLAPLNNILIKKYKEL